MRTRNVVLTDHQAELIDTLVESGRFQNASEVLREGVRLVEKQEADEVVRLEALRAALRVGIVDIEAGRSRVFTDSKALRRHLKSLTRAGMSDAARRKRRPK